MKWFGLIIASLSSSCTALATPITKRQDFTTIDTKELGVLKTHARYASAAYCPQAEVTDWSCATGIAGYIGYNNEEKKIVISFRGSSNWANWAKNLAILPRTFIYPTANENVKVHSGFYETYTSAEKTVRSGLKDVLTQLKDEADSYKLVVTGHSLVGGITNSSFFTH
ncbi:hypothetical protein K7432_008136 [Basidiobolus ranarum]|uniref:Fungal lipase-type domain-containing protein n=1 Tax=Basidiobolus ranarum TaxID=34480 RepID=A0ABR2WSA0_9FUNG